MAINNFPPVVGTANIATNIANGLSNQIVYQGNANVTSFITAPSVIDTYLKWNGTAFTWASVSGGSGTVTSVSGTGSVNGITLTGTVTNSGSLTLGGTLSGVGNAQLTNSSITINGTSVALGGSINVGTVTSVSGTAPVVSSGGATPAISMAKATTLVDGYLSATDWTTFNNKQPAGSYLTTVSVNSPLTGAGTGATPISIPAATSLVSGYLTNTDWSTFNGKQDTLVSGTNIKTINSTSILGSGNISVTASPGGSTTQFQYNNAGTLDGSANLVTDGTNVGVGTTPDGTSWVQIAAGTATKAPLEFITSAGTLMSTPDDGSLEFDGSVFYGTPIANNRGVMLTEHFVARTGTKTMTSNTSLQAIFSGGTGGLTNGALTVAETETYYFECSINVSSMSGTSGNLGFSIVGGGTATFTSAAWHAFGLDATTQTTAAAAGTSFHANQAATGNIVTAVAGTAVSVFIKGIFRINGAGTIIPSIQLTNASAAVIGANSWFKCYPIGSNTVVSVGNWS